MLQMLQPIVRAPRAAEDVAQGIRLARRHGRTITPAAVSRILKATGVEHVIIGAHATNAHSGRPRTTVDVDVVVRPARRAVHAIAAAFPALRHSTNRLGHRFADDHFEAVDLVIARRGTVWERLLREIRRVRVGRDRVTFVTLEGALVSKFAGMLSEDRELFWKYQDAADFGRMVTANPTIDAERLTELGDLVSSGGGDKIVKWVSDARAGRKFEF